MTRTEELRRLEARKERLEAYAYQLAMRHFNAFGQMKQALRQLGRVDTRIKELELAEQAQVCG
jgi:ribosomal protein L29